MMVNDISQVSRKMIWISPGHLGTSIPAEAQREQYLNYLGVGRGKDGHTKEYKRKVKQGFGEGSYVSKSVP